MHFREPVIDAKPKFLALTRVLVYDYWCCQVTILSAYNASVKFLLRYCQPIAMCNKQTENLLMFNAIIPKECKEWSINGKSQIFLKNLLAFMNFMIINTERFSGINVVIAVTKTYFFRSSFILQIVNILVLFSEICVSLIKCDITFWIQKEIWN